MYDSSKIPSSFIKTFLSRFLEKLNKYLNLSPKDLFLTDFMIPVTRPAKSEIIKTSITSLKEKQIPSIPKSFTSAAPKNPSAKSGKKTKMGNKIEKSVPNKSIPLS